MPCVKRSLLLALTLLTGLVRDVIADSVVDPKTPAVAMRTDFESIRADEIPGNIIKMISTDWMLITAGNEKKFNGMTAGWGGLGYWNKPVAFIFVHTARQTYTFLEKEEYFTLSFFDEKYRPALTLFGTKSGRDMDKTRAAGLTAMSVSQGVAYAEAKLIIVCKKGFSTMTTQNEPAKGHKLYFGDIVAVWKKKE